MCRVSSSRYLDIFSVTESQLKALVAEGLASGGSWCDLFFEDTVSSELVLRDGEVSSGGSHEDFGCGVRVLAGEKTGYAYAETTDYAALLRAARAAAAIADGKGKSGPAGSPSGTCATLGTIRGGTASAVGSSASETVSRGRGRSAWSLEKLSVDEIRTTIFRQKEDKRAANKKINMMRRWMVRNDGKVDLGLWKHTNPADLIIPLDVHVYTQAAALGLTDRKQKDIVTARQITDAFREIWPDDPVIGDFALFGYGVTR